MSYLLRDNRKHNFVVINKHKILTFKFIIKMRTSKALRVLNHIMLLAILLFTLFAGVMTCKAQTKSNSKVLVISPAQQTTDSVLVGYFVEIDSVKTPLHVTKNGAYWYWRTSKKTRKQYKCYLTAKQKQELGLTK